MKKSSIDADYILGQHDFAKGQYKAAIADSILVEKLFKAEYNIPNDRGDNATNSGPRVTKPGMGRAIIEKFLTMLAVRTVQKKTVLPKETGKHEAAACSKIERWLSGYEQAYMLETKRNPWRDGAYWYLLRGRACLESRFDPTYLGTEKQCIRTLAPDPNTVYSVWAESGIGWYTKEYNRFAWDITEEIERKSSKRATKDNPRWGKVDLPEDPNEKVSVVEYWDDEWCAATVNGEFLYARQHNYGFVPLAEAHCMDTPLEDMQWAFQSVLAPIMDSLKQTYILASKMAAGVDLFYWPTILVVTEDGRLNAYDGGTIRLADIPMNVKSVQVVAPTPNQAVIQQLMTWLENDIELAGMPKAAWGQMGNLRSGFAIQQVIAQVQDKITDKKDNLELGYGWDWGHKLQLIDKFGDATGFNSKVLMVEDSATGAPGSEEPIMAE